MKNCPNCGKKLADDALFCNACGVSLDNTSATVAGAAANDAAPTVANANSADGPVPPTPPVPPAPMDGAPTPNPTVTVSAPTDGAPTPNPTFTASAPTPGFAAGNGAVPPAGAAVPPITPLDQPKKNKLTPILIAAAAVLVLLILIIAIASSGGYKKPMQDIVKALNAGKADPTAFSGYSDPYSLAFDSAVRRIFKGTEYYEDWADDAADYYEDIYDGFEDDYGKNARFSIEWGDAEKMSNKDIKDYLEDIEDSYDYIDDYLDWEDEDGYEDYADYLADLRHGADLTDKQIDQLMDAFADYMAGLKDVNIQAGYSVDLKITVKGKDDDHTFKLRDAIFLKIDGKWYFVDDGDKDYFYYGRYGLFGDHVMSDLMGYLW